MPADKSQISKTPKKSLILAGGGMRLAYQAGVLIALDEQDLSFDHIDGTSGGIFNAGMLASGLSAHEIAERWRKLEIKHFMSLRPIKNYFKPLKMMGYADADGIRNKIFPALGIDMSKIPLHEGADITFNVCNFSNKTIEAIHHKNVLEDHLIAGVSLPVVMPAIKIDEHWYSDAVWIKDANLLEAVKRGAEDIWLVWAIGNTENYLPGALNQYVHMIEMSANGGLLEEYERIQMINEQISKGDNKYIQSKPVKLNVIKPTYPLPLDPDLYLNKIDARTLINMGYSDAKRALNSRPENGVPFDKDATKMSDPGTRLNIRSEFHGRLRINDTFESTSYYACFVFSSWPDHEILKIYSSVMFPGSDIEIPCFNHQIRISKAQGEEKLQYSCNFLYESSKYELTATHLLRSPVDFMLGLEFKTVKLVITKEDEPSSKYEGKLHQDIKTRLKALYTNNVRREDGSSGGIMLKYRMASKLFNYAI